MKNRLLILFLCINALSAPADDYRKEITVRFPVNVDIVQPQFSDNKASLTEIIQTIKTIQNDSTLEFVDLVYTGYASPEGSIRINDKLSKGRAQVIEDYVNAHIAVPAHVNVQRTTGIAWDELARVLEASDLPYRDAALDIIRNTPETTYDANGNLIGSRRQKLMNLQGGYPWRDMLMRIFPQLRTASVTFIADREIIPEPIEPEPVEEIIIVPEQDTVVIDTVPEPLPLLPKFYCSVHTNLLYDLLTVPNVGAEFYLGKNFSVAGNWQYSWWNSNNANYYWRTYGGYLAGRYWFGKAAEAKPLTGHHAGIYAQALLYDFEVGGTGYLSGKPGKTIFYKPTWGAGIEYGFSLPIRRRLNLDFTIGIGYAQGQYMKYKPMDGHYVWQSTHMRHWFGPTKLEVSLVWLLGYGNVNEKKGGETK